MKSQSQAEIHTETFLHMLMRRQLRLSISCAAAFLVVLLALPLVNYLAPEFMSRRIMGFTLSWMVLGIGFFPVVWVIALIFIKRSIQLEEEQVLQVAQAASAKDSTTVQLH